MKSVLKKRIYLTDKEQLIENDNIYIKNFQIRLIIIL